MYCGALGWTHRVGLQHCDLLSGVKRTVIDGQTQEQMQGKGHPALYSLLPFSGGQWTPCKPVHHGGASPKGRPFHPFIFLDVYLPDIGGRELHSHPPSPGFQRARGFPRSPTGITGLGVQKGMTCSVMTHRERNRGDLGTR